MSIFKGTGFSFSWKRLIGLTGLRIRLARFIGVPTTKHGLERKVGNMILRKLFGRRFF